MYFLKYCSLSAAALGEENSSDCTQKIILDYQMFTLVLHCKIIVKGRNPVNNAITVMYFLTFILKHPVVQLGVKSRLKRRAAK